MANPDSNSQRCIPATRLASSPPAPRSEHFPRGRVVSGQPNLRPAAEVTVARSPLAWTPKNIAT